MALATFNGAAFVAEQVRSLLAQQVDRRLEVVVADDGSTDETVRICREFAAADPRVRVLGPTPDRLGLVANFERALRATTGRLVALCDQDDVWAPDKLATLAHALDEKPDAELAFCDMSVVDGEGRPVAPSYLRQERIRVPEPITLRPLLIRNVVTGCACVLRRRLLEAALPFPAGCRLHDWWLAAVAVTRGRPVFVDRALQAYRRHDANVVGVGGSRTERALRALRTTPDPADPGRFSAEVDRLTSYVPRTDVFRTDDDRADLAFALAFFRDLAACDALGMTARVGLLRRRLRYHTRPSLADRMFAVAGTLAPTASRGVTRFVQRRLRRGGARA